MVLLGFALFYTSGVFIQHITTFCQQMYCCYIIATNLTICGIIYSRLQQKSHRKEMIDVCRGVVIVLCLIEQNSVFSSTIVSVSDTHKSNCSVIITLF